MKFWTSLPILCRTGKSFRAICYSFFLFLTIFTCWQILIPIHADFSEFLDILLPFQSCSANFLLFNHFCNCEFRSRWIHAWHRSVLPQGCHWNFQSMQCNTKYFTRISYYIYELYSGCIKIPVCYLLRYIYRGPLLMCRKGTKKRCAYIEIALIKHRTLCYNGHWDQDPLTPHNCPQIDHSWNIRHYLITSLPPLSFSLPPPLPSLLPSHFLILFLIFWWKK